ncbi:MAG: UDP-N-acetylmuramoyl-tripeptide--D-alanyl-D-alanine ligase [Patescibacteria group bacterium]|jgi:UDP-N-acetylmuramoyl-tripeptide--D-alanyl-D-alanine ligase
MKTWLMKVLADSARAAIRREKLRIIAVAGSVGKSSTKQAIAVAKGAGDSDSRVRASAKNYNNELGIPLTVFHLPAPGRSIPAWIRVIMRATLLRLGLAKIGATTLILEFGTDHPGDLDYLISIAPPDIAVLTAIGAEHTEFFGTIEGVANEERRLIQVLGPDSIAILNADDPEVMKAADLTDAHVVTFGETEKADVRLVSAHVVVDTQDVSASGLDVNIITLGLAARFRIKGAFGKPQALATTAALAVVLALDVDFHEAAERLATFSGMPGRTRIIEGIKRTTLLDDSYNSSPLAALSALRDLAAYPATEGSKRIAALGDMLELGNLAHESHAEIGRAVASIGIDMLVACGTLAHVVADAAKQAGMPEDRIFTFAKSPEAGLFIQDRMKQGDVVLIKGSQGARMEKITKELMAHPEMAKELIVRQTEEWLA